MQKTITVAFLGSLPSTGKCIIAFGTALSHKETQEIMGLGALVECKDSMTVKHAFGTHCNSQRIVEMGPVLGRYLDADIPEWFKTGDGRIHDFSGPCGPRPDFSRMVPGQLILAPGLFYETRK
jgi:hypothetical protein